MTDKKQRTMSVLARLAAEQQALEAAARVRVVPIREGRPSFREWFLLTVEPRRENTVSGHLIAKDIKVFVPMMRDRKKRGITTVMFPRYVFAYLDFEREWPRVRSRPGVLGVIKNADGLPTVVQPEIIERVRQEERKSLSGKAMRVFDVGQEVRIIGGGPWSDMSGPICKLAERDRIGLLLDVLGRRVVVEISEREIEAV